MTAPLTSSHGSEIGNTQRYDLADPYNGIDDVTVLRGAIYDLCLECDARHAHEDALEQQVRELGGEPVQATWLDPAWDGSDIEQAATADQIEKR